MTRFDRHSGHFKTVRSEPRRSRLRRTKIGFAILSAFAKVAPRRLFPDAVRESTDDLDYDKVRPLCP
jgi:hypothetical protein